MEKKKSHWLTCLIFSSLNPFAFNLKLFSRCKSLITPVINCYLSLGHWLFKRQGSEELTDTNKFRFLIKRQLPESLLQSKEFESKEPEIERFENQKNRKWNWPHWFLSLDCLLSSLLTMWNQVKWPHVTSFVHPSLQVKVVSNHVANDADSRKESVRIGKLIARTRVEMLSRHSYSVNEWRVINIFTNCHDLIISFTIN